MDTRLKQLSRVLSREIHLSQNSQSKKLPGYNPKPFPNTMPNQGAIKGTMSTNGQYREYARGWAPHGATHVRFLCKGGGTPTPVFSCGAESQGNMTLGSGVGIAQTWTTVDVRLTSSNEFIKLSFQTTDSNGGEAQWEFIQK